MSRENFTPLRGQSTQGEIQERWDWLRSRIRKTWPEVTADDLREIDGDTRKLVALVHQRTGAEVSRIEQQMDEIAASSQGLMERLSRGTQQAWEATSQRVGDSMSQAYTATQRQIAAAPGRSVGIAFGLGLLVGLGTASMIKDAQSARSSRNWW